MDRLPRTLVAAHVLTVAMVLAVMGYVLLSVVPGLSAARRSARADTCHLIVGLAKAATSGQPRAHASAESFIRRTPLSNCRLYALEDK